MIQAARTDMPGARIRADCIRGMGKVGGGLVIILQITKLLSVGEIALPARGAQGRESLN